MPIAGAAPENYNNYSSLDIKITISSGFSLVKGDKPEMNYISADLLLVPENNFMQEVINLDLKGGDEFSKEEGRVQFIWRNNIKNNFGFSLDSVVKVDNSFKKINNKIKFPLTNLDPEILKYTKASEMIDINNDIYKIALNLSEDEDDLFIVVSKLAEWTRSNIKYDLSTLTADAVQTSSWVLENKKGVCDELTNLFISFLRSLGIPARFVSGMVYSNIDYSWGPHGWAEVYFPEQGWIPFDVTFGQYGWVDPSHIKLQDSLDSSDTSIEFRWKTRDLDVKPSEIKVETKLIKLGGGVESPLKLSINPLVKEVNFGSYIPVIVSAENLGDFYLPINLAIVKGPEVIGDNINAFVLKPKENRVLYWIFKVPSDLDEDFIYSSEVEVLSNFGDSVSDKLKYGRNFKFYSEDMAEEKVKKLVSKVNNNAVSEVYFECVTDKSEYYLGDEVDVKCSLSGNGEFNVCFMGDCKFLDSGGDVSFKFSVEKSGRFLAMVENKDVIKYSGVEINVVGVPDLNVRKFMPDKISYHDNGNLVMDLYSSERIDNVLVKVNGLGVFKLGYIDGDHHFEIPFSGSNFPSGVVEVEISYKDKNGKDYRDVHSFAISIKNLPWYEDFFNIFRRLV